jgi:hypothetical protein
VRIPTNAIPLAVLDLDRRVLVLLFHGLDSTCLRTSLARLLLRGYKPRRLWLS